MFGFHVGKKNPNIFLCALLSEIELLPQDQVAAEQEQVNYVPQRY